MIVDRGGSAVAACAGATVTVPSVSIGARENAGRTTTRYELRGRLVLVRASERSAPIRVAHVASYRVASSRGALENRTRLRDDDGREREECDGKRGVAARVLEN